MEAKDMKTIFERSDSLHTTTMRTTHSFLVIVILRPTVPLSSLNVYDDNYPITKLQCVDRVKKRMYNRLTSLKITFTKGIKLSDGKGISGQGRMTDKQITNYYHLVIKKKNASSNATLGGMRREVWAE